jgi:hypothetical protein
MKTVMGVRTKRWTTGRNRWGEGRVHLLVYDKLNKWWKVYCRDGGDMLPYHGVEVPDDTPVTCKRCLASKLIR